jgi:N6-L-threonylcarbamoyladenine synthase
MKKNIIILAIETSCDETAAAVLKMETTSPSLSLKRRGMGPQIKTLSSVVKSQISIHKSFGGVVPEVAARAHVKNTLPVVKKTLSDSNLTKTSEIHGREFHLSLLKIDYIAVTVGPGLIPSLIVGVEFAKALSLATGKPIIPVNHMLGHLYSPFAVSPSPFGRGVRGEGLFPIISLIVSGGHTILALMNNISDYKVLGQTVDDAAGEAFDKVAKLLGLPYPGGPEVRRLAKLSKSSAIVFPRPMINSKNYDFSFSGLKTAVLYYLRDNPNAKKEDVCKAFQEAAVDVLTTKTMRAVKEYGAKSVSLSGGVAANEPLRSALNLKSKILNLNFFVPQKNLCTDNAEMIGLAACFMLHNGFKPKDYKQIKADPNLEL